MRKKFFTYQQDFFVEFPEVKAMFIKEARKYTFEKKSAVFCEGAPSNACYYIYSGVVRVYRIGENGKEATMAIYASGDIFGLNELIRGYRHHSMAEAMTRTTIYALEREKLTNFLMYNFDFTMEILRLFSRRIEYLEKRLTSMVVYKVMERLIRLLVLYHASTANPANCPYGTPVDIQLSQIHIATMIGSTQCTVSKLLHRLHREGLLDIGRKHIAVPDPAALWAQAFRQDLEDIWP